MLSFSYPPGRRWLQTLSHCSGRALWGLSVCRDQVITSAAAFAVVLHAPAVQPAPCAGRPQARGGLSRVANRPAAAVVEEGLQG